MNEKERDLTSFIKQLKYDNVDVERMINALENPALPAIQRRKIEKYLLDWQIRNAASIEAKCDIILNNEEKKEILDEITELKQPDRKISIGYLNDEQRKIRLQEMVKEKEKSQKFWKNVKVTLSLAVLVGTITFSGFKICKNKTIKNTYNNYNKIFSSVLINSDDTLTSIASKIYEEYPDDIKNITTLNNIIKEIMTTNNLTNPDEIKAGNYLLVPSRYELKEEEKSHQK